MIGTHLTPKMCQEGNFTYNKLLNLDSQDLVVYSLLQQRMRIWCSRDQGDNFHLYLISLSTVSYYSI